MTLTVAVVVVVLRLARVRLRERPAWLLVCCRDERGFAHDPAENKDNQEGWKPQLGVNNLCGH